MERPDDMIKVDRYGSGIYSSRIIITGIGESHEAARADILSKLLLIYSKEA